MEANMLKAVAVGLMALIAVFSSGCELYVGAKYRGRTEMDYNDRSPGYAELLNGQHKEKD